MDWFLVLMMDFAWVIGSFCPFVYCILWMYFLHFVLYFVLVVLLFWFRCYHLLGWVLLVGWIFCSCYCLFRCFQLLLPVWLVGLPGICWLVVHFRRLHGFLHSGCSRWRWILLHFLVFYRSFRLLVCIRSFVRMLMYLLWFCFLFVIFMQFRRVLDYCCCYSCRLFYLVYFNWAFRCKCIYSCMYLVHYCYSLERKLLLGVIPLRSLFHHFLLLHGFFGSIFQWLVVLCR